MLYNCFGWVQFFRNLILLRDLYEVVMDIKTLTVKSNGYVDCKSVCYSAHDILNKPVYEFSENINVIRGDIDSGVWAVSYLLSMYCCSPRDFTLFEKTVICVNGQEIPISEFSKHTCYMDFSYPLFDSQKTVRKLIEKGLKKTGVATSAEEIKELFCLDDQRFERPLKSVGNEVFRAMAAIGYSHNKEVFCFPHELADLRQRTTQNCHLFYLTDSLNIPFP